MLTNSLSALCNANVFAGNYQRAIHLSEEALQISQSSNNVWGQSYSQYLVGWAYWERGKVSQSIHVMEEAVRLGKLSGFTVPQIFTQLDLAIAFGYLGALELALETTKKVSRPVEMINVDVYKQGVLARLFVMSNDIPNGVAALEKWKDYLSRISKYYLNTHLPIILADIELALGRGNFDHAQSRAGMLLKVLRESGMLSQVPIALYLQAQALMGLNQQREAKTRFLEARAEAETIGSRWMLWKILAALRQDERDPDEGEKLRKEAWEHVSFIADHIDQPELKASFLDLPDVKGLY